MSDEYEFDAMTQDSTMRVDTVRVVHASRYRELQRELAEAREENASMTGQRNSAINAARVAQGELFKYRDANDGVYMEALKAELSEARQAIERMRDAANALTRGAVERAEKAEVERDKLQAKLTGILHAADCVLLDPDGRVAIRGSDEDRRILQAAIDAARKEPKT